MVRINMLADRCGWRDYVDSFYFRVTLADSTEAIIRIAGGYAEGYSPLRRKVGPYRFADR